MQPFDRYHYEKEMEKQEKRDRWRMACGVFEFAGVVVGAVLILVLLALLFSLLSWLRQDISSTFTIMLERF